MRDYEFDAVGKSESSKLIRQRVEEAREIQRSRFEAKSYYCNAHMSNKDLKEFCHIEQSGKDLLRQAMQRFGFSARAYSRILKLARTIADLEKSANIEFPHLAEAIQYRSLDRKGMG